LEFDTAAFEDLAGFSRAGITIEASPARLARTGLKPIHFSS
jgi:hypothetical protein